MHFKTTILFFFPRDLFLISSGIYKIAPRNAGHIRNFSWMAAKKDENDPAVFL